MIARYWEIGFIIPGAVLAGFLLGKLLDYWLHARWISIAGVCLGAVAGFAQMVRLALSATREK
jgi:F0F1-type ATP synthase assembly protein I